MFIWDIEQRKTQTIEHKKVPEIENKLIKR